MSQVTIVQDNSSPISSNNNTNNSSQIKVESISISNENQESSKPPIPNQSTNDVNTSMSRLSIHDTRSSTRMSSHRYQNFIPQTETQAQLIAFTPPLMSLQFPYEESYSSYPIRPYIQNQSSFPTTSKSETAVSQPEYYVDSFPSNFSNKTKTKHVTFQEPEPSNDLSKTNLNLPQPSNGYNYSTPVHRYSNPRSFYRYNYPNQHYSYNHFYSQHSNNPRFLPRGWPSQSYYSDQQTSYPHHLFQPKQLYDPNKPKVLSTIESHDSSKVIRTIIPKNKKKTKQINTNENSTPLQHPITILRKPSVDTEEQQQSSSTSVTEEQQQPSSTSVTEEQQQPSSTSVTEDPSPSILSLPRHELLSILQSANCISSLNEYAQQKKFILNYIFSSIPPSSFTCIVSINNRQFPPSSSCSSKIEAQKLACDQALRILYRESCSHELEFTNKHDYIAHQSISTFQDLNVNELLLGRKTLACMLMITNKQYEQACVISIGTGSGCLDETNLSYADDGTALHDCHAEILARRGLIRFLFEQIKQSKDNKSSIFQYNSIINKYELEDNITFHMYISSLPCGNASLNISSNSLRYKQGQIEGTVLASTSSIKYPIKSCSDKICRWNILGIQGGLLINLLSKPIYLETITLACETTFDRNHVKYSLCQRLNEHFHSLPSPFRFHLPDIDCPQIKSFQQERQVAKLQTSAFAWNITQQDRRELLEPMTGRLKNDRSVSSLSKQNLFEDFTNFIQTNFPNDNSLSYTTYQQAKRLNKTYVAVKKLISTALQTDSSDANTTWLSKSDQLEQFSIQ